MSLSLRYFATQRRDLSGQEGQRLLATMGDAARHAFAAAMRGGEADTGDATIARLDALSTRARARREAAALPDLLRQAAGHVDDLQKLGGSLPYFRLITVTAKKSIRVLVDDAVNLVHQDVPLRQAGNSTHAAAEPRALALHAYRSVEQARVKINGLLCHPLIWSDSPPMDEAEIIEALARVENYLSATQPDYLVALNGEATQIADLIASDLNLGVPITTLQGSAADGLSWRGPASGLYGGNPSVCILGHVAWSGATITRAVAETRQRFQTDRVTVAVLATSTEAAERMDGVAPFAFHQVTAGLRVRLGGFDLERLRGQSHLIAQARTVVGGFDT